MNAKHLASLLLIVCCATSAAAQTTTFTYQGRLQSDGAAFSGPAEFRFTVWDAAEGGTQLAATTPETQAGNVSDGLFTMSLDFGATPFATGADRWLQIALRTDLGQFRVLTPRQKFNPTPYAITAANLSGTLSAAQLAGSIPSANLAGTYAGAVTFGNPANVFAGSGAGLTTLDAGALNTGTVPAEALDNAWKTGGNAGTTPGTHFLGTADNQALELRVNGQRGLRLEPVTEGVPNLIGGHANNWVDAASEGAVIAGGGAELGAHTIGFESDYSTIGGGLANLIGNASLHSVIGGGASNRLAFDTWGTTIAGGWNNTVEIGSGFSAVGGGEKNSLLSLSPFSVIAGGRSNQIGASSAYAFIGGGFANQVGGNAPGAVIPGGQSNQVGFGAAHALAAGRRAQANHPGTFVWADSQDADFASTANNQFLVRATGGVGIGTSNPAGAALAVNGTVRLTGLTLPPGAAAGRVLTSDADGNGTWQTPAGYSAGTGLELSGNTFSLADNGVGGAQLASDGASLNKVSGGTMFADPAQPFVGIGRNTRISSSEFFGVQAPVIGNNYGGMYVNTGEASARPFYGYASGGAARAWSYVDGNDANKWKLSVAASDRITVTTTGLVGLGTTTPAERLHVAGNILATGTITPSSDRNVKKNFAPVDVGEVLEQVVSLPLQQWTYRSESDAVRHLGPMAQDFHAAFGLGANDTTIATVDADGVALAAIQGLNRKLEDRSQNAEDRIQQLAAENDGLRKELADLKRLVEQRLGLTSAAARSAIGSP